MKTKLNPLRLKDPVVFVHGMGARSGDGPFDNFDDFSKLLRDARNAVFTPNRGTIFSSEVSDARRVAYFSAAWITSDFIRKSSRA